jgi:transcriptional regulator with XRE-family HTH domain
MRLTQAEIIQILRKRAGLNQGELGAQAFNTTLDSGRTKIKNIELGKQRASEKDLKLIAESLGIALKQLQPLPDNRNSREEFKDGFWVSQKVIDMFPDLREYLEMLEKASIINDLELITYLSKKIANIWHKGSISAEQAPKKITKRT